MSLRLALIALLCACRCNFTAHEESDATSSSDATESDAIDGDVPECGGRTATPVPASGKITGTLAAGSPDDTGTCGGVGIADLLYVIDVPPGSGLLASTDVPGTTANTLLYVRSDCDNPATELECDLRDGAEDNGAHVFRTIAPGRYFVFFDGEPGGAGPVDATIQLLHPDAAACTGDNTRDRCAAELRCSVNQCVVAGCVPVETFTGGSVMRMPVTSGPSHHAGTCGAGNDGGVRAPEIVYRIQLAAGVSNLTVSTDSAMTTYDTLVYVRQGCGGAEVACDDDSGTTMNLASIVNTGPLAAGDYLVFVDGFSTHSGTAAVTITITP